MRSVMRGLPIVLVAVAVLPLLYVAVPLIHLYGGLSWTTVQQVLADPDFQGAVGTSVGAASVTTLAAIVFGLPTAFVLTLVRWRFVVRIVEGLLVLPIVLPPIVGGVGQLSLYGPLSAIGGFFGAHGIALTNSWIGVVLAQSYITWPFLILAAKAGFEEIPRELIEATQCFGGNVWSVFWWVSLPLARSAILSGALLTFARAVGEFGATMIMAYHPYTLPVDIWVQFSSGGLPDILAIAAVVTVGAVLVAVISGLLAGRRRV